MTEAAPHRKVSVQSVLGAPRPRVTRYRPWVIAGIAGALMLVVGAGFWIGFGSGRPTVRDEAAPPDPPASAPVEIDGRLPVSYDDPLALRPAEPAPPETAAEPAAAQTSVASPAPSPLAQERAAARASGPFFAGHRGAASVPSRSPDLAPAPGSEAGAPGGGGLQRLASAPGGQGAISPHLPAAPLSRDEIKAGAIIPAALVTGLNSDLPGPVIAQVTEPVFDHLTGQRVLIPQGARLIGRYDSQVGHGQDRVMVVWTRIVFPDGRSLDIGAMSGADVTGAGGLADQVDTHTPALARAVGLSTLVSIGGAAAQNSLARGSDNLVLQDAASGLAATASDTGRQIVERDLRRAPTLRVRPGWPLRLIVDKDLILPPAGP